VVVVLLISMLGGGGGGLEDIVGQLQETQVPQQAAVQPEEFQGEDDYEVFASTVLGSTDETWGQIFVASELTYAEPTLVLFRGSTQSACGGANSAVGPHYCPPDQTIYLDETFFDELTRSLGAQGGDVAEAYVIAHEVGHHIQNQIGVMDEVRKAQQAAGSQAEGNALSVQMELQADCFAGVWAHSLRDEGVFLPNEIEEAIDAAAAVGDDRIQHACRVRSALSGGPTDRRPSAWNGSPVVSRRVIPPSATRSPDLSGSGRSAWPPSRGPASS
jgi:hypothetical protein